MFKLLNENGPSEDSKQPRWTRHLLQFTVVLAATGSVFGLLYLGMIMME
jgi:hypothetical protein